MAPCTYSNLSHRYCHVSISTAERHLSKQPLRLEIPFLWTLNVRAVIESEFSVPAIKSVLRILIYLVIIKDFFSFFFQPFVYPVKHNKILAFFLKFLLFSSFTLSRFRLQAQFCVSLLTGSHFSSRIICSSLGHSATLSGFCIGSPILTLIPSLEVCLIISTFLPFSFFPYLNLLISLHYVVQVKESLSKYKENLL